MERSRFYWVWGVVVCIGAIISILFIGAPLQYIFGLWGLLMTELVLLAYTAGAASHLHVSAGEMFRIYKPTFRQVAGIVVMVMSGVILAGTAGQVYYALFPEQIRNLDAFSDLFRSEHNLIAWLIVALSPAICEEALHRGLILQTFIQSGLKNRWLIIIGNGLLFGLFHLDPSRFFSTGILGMILAFIMLETRNFALPVLYHLLNNSFSLFVNLASSGGASAIPAAGEAAAEGAGSMLGVFFILSAAALLTLRLGAKLIRLPASTVSGEHEGSLS